MYLELRRREKTRKWEMKMGEQESTGLEESVKTDRCVT